MAHLLSGCYRFGFEAFGISPGASFPPELNVIYRLSNVYSNEYMGSVAAFGNPNGLSEALVEKRV